MLDDPEISDADYDVLFDRLEALEAEHPELVTPDSPTQRVGATPQSGFVTVVHSVPMLSLEKCTTQDELSAWDERCRSRLDSDEPLAYTCEPKIDGVAVSLRYENGELMQAVTRGDDEPSLDAGGRDAERVGRTDTLVLHDQFRPDLQIRSPAEMLFDLAVLRSRDDHKVADTIGNQRCHRELDKRPTEHRDHRLAATGRDWSQSGAHPCREDHRLHHGSNANTFAAPEGRQVWKDAADAASGCAVR